MSKAKTRVVDAPQQVGLTPHQIEAMIDGKIVYMMQTIARTVQKSGRTEVSVEHIEAAIKQFAFDNMA